MAVTLQVSQVRQELYRAAGRSEAAGDGAASTALLGRLFHTAFASLVGPDPTRNLASVLLNADADLRAWQTDLVHHAYRRLVGPQLSEHQAVLQQGAGEVLSFWGAVREVCDWLAELFWTIRNERRRQQPDQPYHLGDILRECLQPEQPLAWEIREPGWTDAVRLVGIADAVFRIPGRDPWCVIELKLGRTAPEADLAQACLYHAMLQAAAPNPERDAGDGALAVIGFLPERRECLFAASELGTARQRLTDLIGRLAGVLPDRPSPPPPEPPVIAGPTAAQIDTGRLIVETFREYGAPIELDGGPIIGPTFLRYPISLGRGVKVSAVKNRAIEVQIRLGLDAPPLINLADGRVIIDIQRNDRQYVRFSEIRGQLPAGDPLHGSPLVPLGIDLDGRLQCADLTKTEHAHILAAGTTGSGKSEWLRAAVAGLVAANTPETLRLLLIDPKRNAFHELKGSPFLYRPIVYPAEESAATVLHELADEMDLRYACLEGADSLAQHVARLGRPVPRIVCVCDEYFDLINRSRNERQAIENEIFRLGAKARAAGIHLILATQQPSRQVIKGALDANIAARVGLKMNSVIESRMLLGAGGAEKLLGNGDLLFKDIGEPVRLQSIYLPPEERERVFGAAVRCGTI